MTTDPLAALNDGFINPLAPDEIAPRLRGPEGRQLMDWLREGGVNAGLLRDVHVSFRLAGEGYQASGNLAGLQVALRGIIYARGFDAYPRLATMLHAAIPGVSDGAQWEGLLRYLQGLAQAMLVLGPREA